MKLKTNIPLGLVKGLIIEYYNGTPHTFNKASLKRCKSLEAIDTYLNKSSGDDSEHIVGIYAYVLRRMMGEIPALPKSKESKKQTYVSTIGFTGFQS